MAVAAKLIGKNMGDVPELVGSKDLAALLDVGPRHLRKLAEKGIAVRAGEGRYDLAKSVRQYVGHAHEVARRNVRNDDASAALRDARRSVIERRLERDDRRLIATSEAVATIEHLTRMLVEALREVPEAIGRLDPLVIGVVDRAVANLEDRSNKILDQLKKGA